jgi:AAA family ATPase
MVHVLEVDHSVLLGRYQGEAEAALRKTFRDARRLAPCLVLVDDLDLLCPDRASAAATAAAGAEQRRQVVSCLLSLVDGVRADVDAPPDPDDTDGNADGNADDTDAAGGAAGWRGRRGVFVIATSARPNAVDPAMRRPGRLDKEVELAVPGAADRARILRALLTDAGVAVGAEEEEGDGDALVAAVDRLSLTSTPPPVTTGKAAAVTVALPASAVRALAARAHGMVGADLLQVVKEAHYLALDRALQAGTAAAPGAGRPTESDLARALARVPPSALREVVVEVPTVRWGDIGGMRAAKAALQQVRRALFFCLRACVPPFFARGKELAPRHACHAGD